MPLDEPLHREPVAHALPGGRAKSLPERPVLDQPLQGRHQSGSIVR